MLYQRLGKYAEAEVLFIKVLDVRKAPAAPRPCRHPQGHDFIGPGPASAGGGRRRRVAPRDGVSGYEKTKADGWRRYHCESVLGGSLAAQDKHAEAEPLVLSGYQGWHQREALMPYEDRPLVEDAATRIVSLYQAWGKPDKAAEWQRRTKRPTSSPSPLLVRQQSCVATPCFVTTQKRLRPKTAVGRLSLTRSAAPERDPPAAASAGTSSRGARRKQDPPPPRRRAGRGAHAVEQRFEHAADDGGAEGAEHHAGERQPPALREHMRTAPGRARRRAPCGCRPRASAGSPSRRSRRRARPRPAAARATPKAPSTIAPMRVGASVVAATSAAGDVLGEDDVRLERRTAPARSIGSAAAGGDGRAHDQPDLCATAGGAGAGTAGALRRPSAPCGRARRRRPRAASRAKPSV